MSKNKNTAHRIFLLKIYLEIAPSGFAANRDV